MQRINDIDTQDDYAAALTIEDDQANLVSWIIANNPVFVRLRPARRETGGEQSYGPDILRTTESLSTPNVSGAKFRSAIAGSPAKIIATLVGPDDPQIGASVPFSQRLSSSGAVGDVLTGAIFDYAGTVAPDGYALCDGAAVSRDTFAALFAVIGTTFGVGDGSTTFNLPDLRGRVSVGVGTHADVNARGNNDGVTAANRRPKHRHSPHTHTIGGGNPVANDQPSVALTSINVRTEATNGADGGSGNANDSLDAPAYLVLNKIIKT